MRIAKRVVDPGKVTANVVDAELDHCQRRGRVTVLVVTQRIGLHSQFREPTTKTFKDGVEVPGPD